MPTTTGPHPLTYMDSGATGWYATYQTYAQDISDFFDDIGTTRIDQLNDANGNALLVSTATASAVNHLGMANAATGAGPTLTTLGDDLNVDLLLTPKGSGAVILSGISYPIADGTANQIIVTDGAGTLSFFSPISSVVEDTTPQLGGSLDVNGNGITSSGDIPITLGDASGANSLLIKDSGAVTVTSINSDGDISCTDITAATLSTTGVLDSNTLKIAAGTAITGFVDEDDMVSNSDVKTPSQQSIKAYTDAQAAANSVLNAYVYWTDSGSVSTIQDSFNVDSITDQAFTIYTINFTAGTFTSNDYIATGHARGDNTTNVKLFMPTGSDQATTRTTSAYEIEVRAEYGSTAWPLYAEEINMMFIGGQN